MLSFNNTVALMAVVAMTAYVVGLMRHHSYSQQTAELTAETLVDAGIRALVMRDISRRVPSGSILPNGKFDDSWFRSHKAPFYLVPRVLPPQPDSLSAEQRRPGAEARSATRNGRDC